MSTTTDQSLTDVVVKEAVGAGLDSSLREPILEAVRESEGGGLDRNLPMIAVATGIGVAAGYVLGSYRSEPVTFEPTAAETADAPVVGDVVESTTDEFDAESTTDDGGSRLSRVLFLAVLVGGGWAVRRWMRSGDDEGWEPVEEFDVSTPTDEPGPTEMTDEESASTSEMDEDAEAIEATDDDGDDGDS